MLFSVHRAKTGGTSLTYAYQSRYQAEELLSLGKVSLTPSNKKLMHLLLSNDRESLYESFDKVQYVTGHYNDISLLWFCRNFDSLKTFLLIRHPIPLFWSSFHHKTLNFPALTPEQHLNDFASKGLHWFLLGKYGRMFPAKFFDKDKSEFLSQFKYIFDTSNISNVLPQINPTLSEFAGRPRRQMADDPRKSRHQLQDCDKFRIELEITLLKDIEYYNATKFLIDSTQYNNKNYNSRCLKNYISTFRQNNSLLDVRDPFLELLRKKIKSDFHLYSERNHDSKKVKNMGKRLKQWKNILNNYGLDVDDTGSMHPYS